MKTRKFVPLATIIGGFTIAFVDAFVAEADFNVNLVTALIYAGLGSSAAVGFATYWKGKKKDE